MNKVELDIGKNMIDLMEKLANQIGTTLDKVYPWFVRQQIIEGLCWIVIPSLLIFLFLILLKKNFRKADWDDMNINALVSVLSITLILIFGILLLIKLPNFLPQILNPNYYAIQDMSTMIGRLVK